MKISGIVFMGKPENYGVIDNVLSHSAQPKREDFSWLKEQGITDIINFRTMIMPELDYEEKTIVEALGMNYHNIPSYTRHPYESNVNLFLKKVEEIKSNNGKAHMHCKAGADRTGMYAFIYKMLKGIGSGETNKAEWLRLGHHFNTYPNLMDWAESFVRRALKSSK